MCGTAAQRRRPARDVCGMATALESLRHRHSPAQPPPQRSSRAAATAAWQVPRPAPCSRRQHRLLVLAAHARASRRRPPRAAAHERLGIDCGLCWLRPCARARSGVHMQAGLSAWRFVRGLDSILAQCSPLRGYSTHTQRRGALVRQRLGGAGGGAPAHAQRRRTPAQQSTKRPWQRWLRVRMWVGVSPVLAQRWAA